MHNNFYFLRQLSSSLEKVLASTVISECYSQNKDEIIFRFETHAQPFYLKANLNPSLSALSFPTTLERAKKNSVDLFNGTIGRRVTGVTQFANERSFSIDLEEDRKLLFKMHGNRSNIIAFEKGAASELFRNNLPADAETDPATLHRSIDWRFEVFKEHHQEPQKLYFTFGKVVWLYLKERNFDSLGIDQKWELIQTVLHKLENPEFFLTTIKGSLHLTLLPFENSKQITGDPVEIANHFYYAFTQEYVLDKEKQQALSALKNKLSSGLTYYEKTFQKLTEIENDSNYKHWADLIMANMHQIRQGEERVSLADFYHVGHIVEIKLKKELTPQANAANFYRKAKNQHIEIERLQKSLAEKEREIEVIRTSMNELEAIDDLRSLRKKVQSDGIQSEKGKKLQPVPYHEFILDGFRIWVGKNAQSNDELTLKYAYKDDLWLHAKDVAGSHVIVKLQSGKKFPKNVIERAAQLAAYNSKRKNDTLCPVIVTQKKYVRKRKGDPAGAVVVEREDVMMVEPRL